jgi:hypothetical protein
MTDEEFETLNQDFVDFLNKIVMNYSVNYPVLAGMIMARMVSLAKIANSRDILLKMLPVMEKSLVESDDTYH